MGLTLTYSSENLLLHQFPPLTLLLLRSLHLKLLATAKILTDVLDTSTYPRTQRTTGRHNGSHSLKTISTLNLPSMQHIRPSTSLFSMTPPLSLSSSTLKATPN